MICKTEEDAVNEVKRMKREMGNKFCPVISRSCRKDCQCYRPASLGEVNIKTGACAAFAPYCENPLVCGYIVVNVE